jgi:serine protease Do
MISKYTSLRQYIFGLTWLAFLCLINHAQLYAKDFNQVITKYQKSIVKVSSFSTQGTGFIVSETGHIITCQRLITDAERIQVTVENGETYTANRVGSYPEIDISIIKLDNIESLVIVDLGDSDKLKVGDWVMSGGYYQKKRVFTAGIVLSQGNNFIQTDSAAPIEFDGGPLFDLDGKVVGVIGSGIINKDGIRHAIAIPINLIKPILDNSRITHER